MHSQTPTLLRTVQVLLSLHNPAVHRRDIVTRKIKVCKTSFSPILLGMAMLKFISQRMPEVGGKSRENCNRYQSWQSASPIFSFNKGTCKEKNMYIPRHVTMPGTAPSSFVSTPGLHFPRMRSTSEIPSNNCRNSEAAVALTSQGDGAACKCVHIFFMHENINVNFTRGIMLSWISGCCKTQIVVNRDDNSMLLALLPFSSALQQMSLPMQ